MSKKVILIDERHNGEMPYVICYIDNKLNVNEIIGKGVFTEIKEIYYTQMHHVAKVFIDVMMHETALQYEAHHHKWKIIRTKQNEFPYISFIVNLNR